MTSTSATHIRTHQTLPRTKRDEKKKKGEKPHRHSLKEKQQKRLSSYEKETKNVDVFVFRFQATH